MRLGWSNLSHKHLLLNISILHFIFASITIQIHFWWIIVLNQPQFLLKFLKFIGSFMFEALSIKVNLIELFKLFFFVGFPNQGLLLKEFLLMDLPLLLFDDHALQMLMFIFEHFGAILHYICHLILSFNASVFKVKAVIHNLIPVWIGIRSFRGHHEVVLAPQHLHAGTTMISSVHEGLI